MENLYENFKKYANKAYNQVAPLIPFSNANEYNFNPKSKLYQNTKELNIQNATDELNQQMANYRANQNGTFMLNALTKSDEEKQKDSIDFDNKFIDLATAKGYTPHKAIDKDGKARYAIEKDGVFKEIDPSFLNDFKANSYEMLGSLAGVAAALPHPYAKTAGMAGKVLTPMVGSAVGSGAGAMADTYLNNKRVGENTTAEQLANSFAGGANNDILGAGLATAITSKPAINALKWTDKTALNIADKGLAGVGARHILSQNIGGAKSALTANLGGDHEFKNALESAKDALGADLDNFVRTDLKTIDKTSKYIQKGIDIANSAINKTNEMLKGLNVGKADAELLLSALGHENGVKNILDSVANNPKSAQKIAEMSSSLNKSFSDSINEQLAKFETQTPKDSFKNSFNQVKRDYADAKDFLIKNSNYQSDFKALSDNLAGILSDTQNISTRGVFNALNGGGNLDNLLNAKNAINEQLGYINKADFKSSSDFINQKALNEAKDLIESEINTALKNDENLINLYKTANGDYATMKNVVDSNLMNQISRDGKTSLEALNAMTKSNENINGVTLNDFLGSLGAKDRAVAEANIIKNLMDKNSVNGVVDFRALNKSLNSLDFGSDFAKELKSQILSKQSILNNTSDILNSLGDRVIKPKTMSQGVTNDPLKRGETMRANFIVEKLKPLIPRLGNNEALKLHLNKAILNANGDFKLAIKNIDNIPGGNLPTPTRNLLNEFKNAVKEIEEQVVKTDNQAKNQANLVNNSMKGDGFVTYPNSARQETAINQNFNIQEWVKNMSGVLSDEWRVNLTKLAKKHPEMFRSEADVFRVIKEIKDNPTHFFKNYDDEVALIGKQINDNKFANIGIVKDDGEIIHANKNKIKDLDRLRRRNKEMLTGTPLPATTRANNSMGGDLLQHSDAETIPNQSIKQAENLAKEQVKEPKAKDPTQDAPSELYKAHRKAQKAKETTQEPKATIATKSQEPKANLAQITAKTAEPKTEPISEAPKPTAEPKTQATKEADIKADKKAEREKEQARIKAYVEGLERDAINKIEALNNFTKAKAETIPLKSIRLQAEQELKEFAKSIGTSEEKLNNFKIKSLDDLKDQLDGLAMYFNNTKDKKAEALLNKYIKILDDIFDARFNQRAVKKQNETQKDDLIKGVVDSLKGLQIVGLRNLSNFLTKYGKTDEFMTKANSKWKSEFDKARALMERDQNITPIKEFGTNYAEFYHDGANAIKKLLTEKQGQVAGAFERKELGDIDLVWGEVDKKLNGYGLSKIEAKHLNDFTNFNGANPTEKMINGIAEIIEKGEIKPRSGQNGVNIEYNGFIVGINKGFNGAGDNKWVVTAFDNSMSKSEKKAKTARTDNFTSEVNNLSQNSKPNSTPKEIKSQAPSVEQKAGQYAKWPPQASDELYKAYDKAKRT
ncbi:putative barnase/colicin E5 family endoribonuclease [Campylobacter hyointestinalis]|uniref:putative barnase/colicin E5 family endoribonuclease n=1 Tax=Campylobacter hyointestinalis TaxID=198 RepID=UPI000DCDF42D|nr:hypothetical protein [Campylobacter hyointestinalis]RAZ49107.1 hypothetical protein CHL9004_08270 [Campylobacter hyointestinalis subsp. lawsonii]